MLLTTNPPSGGRVCVRCKELSVECGVLSYFIKTESTEGPSVVVCCIPLCVLLLT